jgi:hypothetical protein
MSRPPRQLRDSLQLRRSQHHRHTANRAAMPDANHDARPKVADTARTYVFLAAPESGLISGAAVPV